MAIIHGTQRTSLEFNLAAVVGSVLVMNGLIFGLGWDSTDRPERASVFALPGWLIGTVWTGLFALMAVARWRLGKVGATSVQAWVTWLVLYCLAYPLYALAPNNMTGGFIGNLGTIALAAYVVRRAWPLSRTAAACVLAVVPWVSFATLTIMAEWDWFGG